MLIERFGWSLHEIDMTNIESLIPFVMSLHQRAKIAAGGHQLPAGKRQVFCDQVSWL